MITTYTYTIMPLMIDFLEINPIFEDIYYISDNFGLFLICVSGILAIMTPLAKPMWFMPHERDTYLQIFRNANIILTPSIYVFTILILFWNLILPILNISKRHAIEIIGSVYLYILMVYSLVDNTCTPGMSIFLSTNILVIMILYNTDHTTVDYQNVILLLTIFIGLCWYLHLRKHSLTQNIQWYMWYAGTFGGTLRW